MPGAAPNKTTALVQAEPVTALAPNMDFDVEREVARVVAQGKAIKQLMDQVLKRDEHYGVIPGTDKGKEKPKPTLLQPGAEKIMQLFRLRVEFEFVEKVEDDTFVAFTVRCRLFHINTGAEWGAGLGSSNSRERKYANQSTAKLCPKCGLPAIIKGKAEFGGGWLCFGKKGGCGAKFDDRDPEIIEQTGAVDKTAVWDLHNTLVKMACKRAKVAAVLSATAASDFFTQDLEDKAPDDLGGGDPPPSRASAQRAGSRPTHTESRAQPTQRGVAKDGTPMAPPDEIRKLWAALDRARIGDAEADEYELKGDERAEAIKQTRIRWISDWIGRKVAQASGELSSKEVTNLLPKAEAGEYPNPEGDDRDRPLTGIPGEYDEHGERT